MRGRFRNWGGSQHPRRNSWHAVAPLRVLGASAVIAISWAGGAHSQLAASGSITSDYRYRGGSIGSDQPAITLNLSYDSPVHGQAGSYIGGAATFGQLPGAGWQVFSHTEYIGLAGSAFRDATWDVGASNTFLTNSYKTISSHYDPELFAGLKTKIFSYYFRYSPHYFLSGVGALYAEINSSAPISERLRIFAHVGVLTPILGGQLYYPRREQYDARLGAAAVVGGAEFSLAWTFRRPGYGSIGPGSYRPDALVVTATCFF